MRDSHNTSQPFFRKVFSQDSNMRIWAAYEQCHVQRISTFQWTQGSASSFRQGSALMGLPPPEEPGIDLSEHEEK